VAESACLLSSIDTPISLPHMPQDVTAFAHCRLSVL
jgi:hypothetical protein